MEKFIKLFILFFSFFYILCLPAYSDITEKELQEYVKDLDDDELIGQKIIISPPWLLPQKGFEFENTYSSSILDNIIEELKIGNFIINKKNYENWIDHLNKEHNLNDVNKDEKKLIFSNLLIKNECQIIQERLKKKGLKKKGKGKGIPGIIATDYEGGRVQHLPIIIDNKKIQIPSAMSLGAIRSRKKARDIGSFIAKNLKWFGVNVNLAPVLDLNYSGETSLIGTRSLSCNPNIVALLATEFSKGLIDQGIAPVLKHWPGHGPVTFDDDWKKSMDFHYYPKPLHLQHDEIHTIKSKYLKPYYHIFEAISDKNYAVMTSHLIANSLGCPRRQDIPVTFCKEAIDENLRHKFDGVIIADDYVLLSSTHERSLEEAIWSSFKAGNDMVILGSIHLDDLYKSKQREAQKLLNINNAFDINYEKIKKIIDYLKEQYSYDNKDRNELRKSVFRILRWKLNIQKMRKGKPSDNNIWDYSVFQPDTDKKIIFSDNELESINNIFYDSLVFIQYRPKQVQKDGSKVKCPIELPSPDDGQIFCITPTLKSGDLKRAFNNMDIENVIEYELYYETNSVNFIAESIAEIKEQINKNNIKLIIFGLVNNYLHIEILKQLNNFIDNTNIESVVICFHDPSILYFANVPKNALIFTTFSNKYISNVAAVKFLKGDIKIRDIKYLPVRHPSIPSVDTLIDEEPGKHSNINPIKYYKIKLLLKIKYLYLIFFAFITFLVLRITGLELKSSIIIAIIPLIFILIMNIFGIKTIEALQATDNFHGFIELIDNKFSNPELVIDILFVLFPSFIMTIVPILIYLKKHLFGTIYKSKDVTT